MELEAPIQRKPHTSTVITMKVRSGHAPLIKGTPINKMTSTTTMIRPDQPAAIVPLS
ncbi:hypothetical protein D3C73_1397830 [compost metagenome]